MGYKLTELFETEECSRCWGSGKHSYSLMHGDVCFGCWGSGRQWTKKHRAMANEYADVLRKSKEVSLSALVAGEIVATGGFWREVIAVSHTNGTAENNCGWSSSGTEGQPGYEKRYSGWHAFAYRVDGATVWTEPTGDQILRRAQTWATIVRLCSPKTIKFVTARKAEIDAARAAEKADEDAASLERAEIFALGY